MYQARVYRVMIATPGDVAAEREVVRKTVHRWNALWADHHRLVLLPVGWDTHARPEMGDRPQAVINKQVLKDCDVLVAVFWTRLGSPTGEAPSGTVEEIEEHLKAGKPAMIYFSDAPVRRDSVDDDQWKALKEFRAECERRGLVHSFESVTDFAEKFEDHLIGLVIEKWVGSSSGSITADAQWQARGGAGRRPKLSGGAWALLREAAKDRNGTILRTRTMSGLSVGTNGREFVEDRRNPKVEARWELVVRELADVGLIQDRGHKNEVFAVTHEGFAAVEGAPA